MKNNTWKRTITASVLGLTAFLGTSLVANAQNNRQAKQQSNRGVEKQHPVNKQQPTKIDSQQARLQQQRLEQERIRLQQEKIRLEQQRLQQQKLEQQRKAEQQRKIQQANRYRVYQNNRYYQVDSRQTDLLKQAINMGYQQGLRAGQSDRGNRQGGMYNNSAMYKSGNYGYQNYVDSSLYQYYFRQGFQRGYDDGYNSRHQYGNSLNGNSNIFATILQSILNLQTY